MSGNEEEPRPGLTKVEYETLADFRYALRRFLRQAELNARSVGLTPQQYQALLAIHGFPGRDYATIGELAERLQLVHHSAVELVDRLERRGLVVRLLTLPDRRQVGVSLTEQGAELLGRAAAGNRAELRRLGPDLFGSLQELFRLEPTGNEPEAAPEEREGTTVGTEMAGDPTHKKR